jgi:hypothetical protein
MLPPGAGAVQAFVAQQTAVRLPTPRDAHPATPLKMEQQHVAVLGQMEAQQQTQAYRYSLHDLVAIEGHQGP